MQVLRSSNLRMQRVRSHRDLPGLPAGPSYYMPVCDARLDLFSHRKTDNGPDTHTYEYPNSKTKQFPYNQCFSFPYRRTNQLA